MSLMSHKNNVFHKLTKQRSAKVHLMNCLLSWVLLRNLLQKRFWQISRQILSSVDFAKPFH